MKTYLLADHNVILVVAVVGIPQLTCRDDRSHN